MKWLRGWNESKEQGTWKSDLGKWGWALKFSRVHVVYVIPVCKSMNTWIEYWCPKQIRNGTECFSGPLIIIIGNKMEQIKSSYFNPPCYCCKMTEGIQENDAIRKVRSRELRKGGWSGSLQGESKGRLATTLLLPLLARQLLPIFAPQIHPALPSMSN